MKMNEKRIAVLGSTGSVGLQALDVARHHGLRVSAISGQSSIGLLEEQIREFHPLLCGVADEKAAADLKIRVADTDCKIVGGISSSEEIAATSEADTVLNSVTGIAGLRPSLAAVRAKKDLALANKETVVAGGELFMDEVRANGVRILPVDSEHSAIFQCLGENGRQYLRRIILTASGGPFYGKTRTELDSITPEETLAHPTWKMGPKITVDSATLMNKGFEVIEAVHLFSVTPSMVEVVVHPQSIIHSMVEYTDKAAIAQLSCPDMRLCIQYALSCPKRVAGTLKPLDLIKVGTLTFGKPDLDTFALLATAYRAAKQGGIMGAVLNGANEAAVELFLHGKISFTDITDMVNEVYDATQNIDKPCWEDIFRADREARNKLYEKVN